jgi:hypothetical protein
MIISRRSTRYSQARANQRRWRRSRSKNRSRSRRRKNMEGYDPKDNSSLHKYHFSGETCSEAVK